jgi:hypothetical protein
MKEDSQRSPEGQREIRGKRRRPSRISLPLNPGYARLAQVGLIEASVARIE